MTSASVSSIDTILQAATRTVEIQKTQIEMAARFKNNMEAFKLASKPIYDKFIRYTPKELCLSYSEQGYLDLVNNNARKKSVYGMSPVEYAEQQVNNFAASPSVACINYCKTPVSNAEQISPRAVNELIDKYEHRPQTDSVHMDVNIGLLLVTGCGMGYHLEKLIKHSNIDIKRIFIYDPHPDSFYASLHIVDWVGIIQHFSGAGRMLKLFIDKSAREAMMEMKYLRDEIGLHNFSYTFFYRHLNSVKETAFIDLYKKEFHLLASGVGFFDDEQIGMAHTVGNMNKGFNVFSPKSSLTDLPPIFLIGNGPSLDEHIDYIRSNRNNALIVTCGTAISSLYKTGIKPDYHVEMERNSATASYIDNGTSAEYRKGITLLCLNTAPPNMVALFDDVKIALKPNDLGTLVFKSQLDGKTPKAGGIENLEVCNPTVTNAGLSFTIDMGFKQVVLLGIDLGVRQDGTHHSALSIYYDLEKKTKRKGFTSFEETKNNQMIPGNFGGEVSSNVILHRTKNNMELKLRNSPNKDRAVYNPNKGALIIGATPIERSDIPLFPALSDKPTIKQRILDHYFVSNPDVGVNAKTIKSLFLSKLIKKKSVFLLRKDIKSSREMMQEMDRIWDELQQLEVSSPLGCLLIRGSIQTILALIVKYTFFSKGDEFNARFKMGREDYIQLVANMFRLMEKNPLQNDTTVDKVAVQLRD